MQPSFRGIDGHMNYVLSSVVFSIRDFGAINEICLIHLFEYVILDRKYLGNLRTVSMPEHAELTCVVLIHVKV